MEEWGSSVGQLALELLLCAWYPKPLVGGDRGTTTNVSTTPQYQTSTQCFARDFSFLLAGMTIFS